MITESQAKNKQTGTQKLLNANQRILIESNKLYWQSEEGSCEGYRRCEGRLGNAHGTVTVSCEMVWLHAGLY